MGTAIVQTWNRTCVFWIPDSGCEHGLINTSVLHLSLSLSLSRSVCLQRWQRELYGIIIDIISSSSSMIYPLTARVVGAPQIISQPVSSILPCYPLPSGTWRTLGLSIPLCCLPTSSTVCLDFFFPFTVPCRMVSARPDEWEAWPYHFSLRLFTIVRSSYGPIAGWILARTSSLVTWSLYEMPGRTSPTVPANVQVHILCPIEEIHNCCLITNFILSIMRITSGIC